MLNIDNSAYKHSGGQSQGSSFAKIFESMVLLHSSSEIIITKKKFASRLQIMENPHLQDKFVVFFFSTQFIAENMDSVSMKVFQFFVKCLII